MSPRSTPKVAANNTTATVAPSATPARAAGAIRGLAAIHWRTIERAIATFRKGFIPLVAELHAALEEIPSDPSTHAIPAWGKHKEVAAHYAAILRMYPDITSRVSADAIDGGLAVDAALARVKSDFEQALAPVEFSARRAGHLSWSGARVVRSAAKSLPDKDGVLLAKIATAEALLRRGKLVNTTADAAEKAQTGAVRAQQKAARATAKANKAADTAARAALAHAAKQVLSDTETVVPAGGKPPKT